MKKFKMTQLYISPKEIVQSAIKKTVCITKKKGSEQKPIVVIMGIKEYEKLMGKKLNKN